MNVPFESFRDSKILGILYLQENPDFQQIIIQARNNIFCVDFLHLLTLNEIFQNN